MKGAWGQPVRTKGDGKVYGNGKGYASGFGETGQPIGYASPDGTETVPAWECVEGCPIKMLDEQSGELQRRGNRNPSAGGNSLVKCVPDGGSSGPEYNQGDTGGASRFFYCAKASRSERTCSGKVANKHPTVKPVALMEYLCRLTKTPTGGVVLDPFMGSGSTGIACVKTGRGFIGIEKDEESYNVSVERIEHALSKKRKRFF